MTGPLRPHSPGVWRQPGRMDCPACGYATDAFGETGTDPADRRAPETGDWSICANCGEVDVIDIHPLLGATVRAATGQELVEFAADPANTAAVRKMHLFNAENPRPGPR